ncbi:MAG: dihydrodipicolinate synthase family protein [Candidatus Hydrogenedentes bacterium]|nr:dihydrodipicolinate synthase family protein [Candidatus Hydrogenedentota bacterium]
MSAPVPPEPVLKALFEGKVIPAHPLALTKQRKLDERRQRALTRYYCAAGAGGVAVAVHTTQFAIREATHGLFQPVIELAGKTMDECAQLHQRAFIKIGGICGPTAQAVTEAEMLQKHGYHIGMVSLSALKTAGVDALIEHCRTVADVVPIMGFYLQPAVGGRLLPVEFWRRFGEIENAVAVKIAPFNRYQTLDVVRGIAESGRAEQIALYTGNDDSIVTDLLTTYRIKANNTRVKLRIVGGLLGHWACWTRPAVLLLEECHRIVSTEATVPHELLTRAAEVTDANAAFFDVAHSFAGCIAGIHEVLVRQGLMAGRWCLDPKEDLSPGQKEEISRVYDAYPHLNDDAFVAKHLEEWLK